MLVRDVRQRVADYLTEYPAAVSSLVALTQQGATEKGGKKRPPVERKIGKKVEEKEEEEECGATDTQILGETRQALHGDVVVEIRR